MPRPTGPSNLAQQQGTIGGFPMMPMGMPQQQQQQAAPQPAAGGRIPVSGGGGGALDALFREADRMAKMSSGGEMVNGQFQPDEETMKAYQDYRLYNKLYQNGPYNPHSIVAPVQRLKATRNMQRNMDLMSLSGMPQSEILTKLGHTAQGDGGNSAASTAAQKEAEDFLRGMGFDVPQSSSGGSSGGSSSSRSSGSSRSSSVSQRSSSNPVNAAVTGGIGATEPGRIPVSTGTAATPGSITTKPQGVSNSDWQKYKSLSDKIANRDRPISDKNQKWYDNFVSKYGSTSPPPAGGGGGGGGTSTPPPAMPQTYADIGLLTRPYDNPFERRNLWNLFPNAGGA